MGNFLLSLASDAGADLIILAVTAALGIAAKRGFGEPLSRFHWPTAWVSACVVVATVALLAPRWFLPAYVTALLLGTVSLWRIGSETRKKRTAETERAAHAAVWESRRQSAIRDIVRCYNLSLFRPESAAEYLSEASGSAATLLGAWAHPHELTPGSQLMNANQTLTHAAKGEPGTVSAERLHFAILDIARLAGLESLVLHRPAGAPERLPAPVPTANA